MQVVPFEPAAPTDADVAAWQAVQAASYAADLPGWPIAGQDEVRADLRRQYAADERRLGWIATDGADPVGVANVDLLGTPNDAAGFVEIMVHPERRRRSAGTTLLAAAAAAVVADGRDVLHADVAEGGPGIDFVEHRGFRLGLRAPMSLLDVAAPDGGWLDKLVDTEHPGYRLLRWRDTAPGDLVDSYAVAKSAMADAPKGDTGWQTPVWHSERVRHDERDQAAAGRESYVVVAVATAGREDGAVAGLTEVQVNHWDPHRAGQEDTAVVPAHRGHGLGLWIKAVMLQWLRAERPDVTEIVTWNAETNRHMRAINEALGFRVDGWWRNYRADLSS